MTCARAGLMLSLVLAWACPARAEEELRIVRETPGLSVDWKNLLNMKNSGSSQVLLLEDGRSIWFGRQPGTDNGYLVYFDAEGRPVKEVLASERRVARELTPAVLRGMRPGQVFYGRRARLLRLAEQGRRITHTTVATAKAMPGQDVVGVHQVFLHQLDMGPLPEEEPQDVSLDAVSHSVVIYDLQGRRLYGFEDNDIGTVLGVSAHGRYFVYSSEINGDLVLVKRPGQKIQGWSRKRNTFFSYRFTDNEKYLLLVSQATGAADVFDLEKKAFVLMDAEPGAQKAGARGTFRVSKDGRSVEVVKAGKRAEKTPAAAPLPFAGQKQPSYPGWWNFIFGLFLGCLLYLRFGLRKKREGAQGKDAKPRTGRRRAKALARDEGPSRQQDLFPPPQADGPEKGPEAPPDGK